MRHAVVLLVLLALVCGTLVSCGTKSSGEAKPKKDKELKEAVGKGGAEAGKEKSVVAAAEAKQKRVAEIIREITAMIAEAKKNPKLFDDPEMRQKADALSNESDKLLNELVGGNVAKEGAKMIEVAEKYAPEHLQTVKDMVENKRQAFLAMAKARLQNIRMSLLQYRMDYAAYPSTEDGLKALIKADDPKHPPYLIGEESLQDPWHTPFVYKLINPDQFTLKSLGPDTKEGTADDILSD